MFLNDPWSYVLQGEYEKAIELYKKAYDRDQHDTHLNNLGIIFLLKNDFVTAKEYFLQAIEKCDPKYIGDSQYIKLGISEWCLNRPYQAIENFRRSLDTPYTDAAGGVTSGAVLLYAGSRLNDQAIIQEALKVLNRCWSDYVKMVKRRMKKANRTIDHDTFSHAQMGNWPGAIVPYLLGIIDDVTFAKNIDRYEGFLRIRTQSEIDFYIGLRSYRENNYEQFRIRMKASANPTSVIFEDVHFLARWEVMRNFPIPPFPGVG